MPKVVKEVAGAAEVAPPAPDGRREAAGAVATAEAGAAARAELDGTGREAAERLSELRRVRVEIEQARGEAQAQAVVVEQGIRDNFQQVEQTVVGELLLMVV